MGFLIDLDSFDYELVTETSPCGCKTVDRATHQGKDLLEVFIDVRCDEHQKKLRKSMRVAGNVIAETLDEPMTG
jgi:hypothetical protein